MNDKSTSGANGNACRMFDPVSKTTIPAAFLKRAVEWRRAHRAHVTKLVATAKGSFEPCHEDMRRPELWKAESWKWLASTEGAETHG